MHMNEGFNGRNANFESVFSHYVHLLVLIHLIRTESEPQMSNQFS